jgi:hypothetical protein
MSAIPPLLMLCEGRKPRARKAPLARPKEIVLHMAVANVLRDHGHPDWRWTHIPSGEVRDMRTAAKLKQMGTKRGWPDFLLVSPDGAIRCLELKRIGGKLTDDQANFQTSCIAHAVRHSVCRTFDEALAVLDAWSCLRIKIGGRYDSHHNRRRPSGHRIKIRQGIPGEGMRAVFGYAARQGALRYLTSRIFSR